VIAKNRKQPRTCLDKLLDIEWNWQACRGFLPFRLNLIQAHNSRGCCMLALVCAKSHHWTVLRESKHQLRLASVHNSKMCLRNHYPDRRHCIGEHGLRRLEKGIEDHTTPILRFAQCTKEFRQFLTPLCNNYISLVLYTHKLPEGIPIRPRHQSLHRQWETLWQETRVWPELIYIWRSDLRSAVEGMGSYVAHGQRLNDPK
jgi:hypothetical protein